MPASVFCLFVDTYRPLKDGYESPGKTRDFSGSECSCPPPCLRGFMELEDLFRVDPEGVRLQNQQEPIPRGKLLLSMPNLVFRRISDSILYTVHLPERQQIRQNYWNHA